jgi:hypothetical protein
VSGVLRVQSAAPNGAAKVSVDANLPERNERGSTSEASLLPAASEVKNDELVGGRLSPEVSDAGCRHIFLPKTWGGWTRLAVSTVALLPSRLAVVTDPERLQVLWAVVGGVAVAVVNLALRLAVAHSAADAPEPVTPQLALLSICRLRELAGVDLFTLSRRMGTSLAMIDASYGHLAPDADERERVLLDAYDDARRVS